MPDITMCDRETCPLRATCYRNEASGTKPSEYRQAWFIWRDEDKEGEDCDYYWPVEGRR